MWWHTLLLGDMLRSGGSVKIWLRGLGLSWYSRLLCGVGWSWVVEGGVILELLIRLDRQILSIYLVFNNQLSAWRELSFWYLHVEECFIYFSFSFNLITQYVNVLALLLQIFATFKFQFSFMLL